MPCCVCSDLGRHGRAMMRRQALAMALLAVGGLLAPSAQAQPARRFPADALRGEMTFGAPPQVVLNKVAAQLSPGVRVHNTLNQFVPAGTLTGQTLVVHYVRDISGLVREVWVLRDTEIANVPWPSTVQESQTWQFYPADQRWVKP